MSAKVEPIVNGDYHNSDDEMHTASKSETFLNERDQKLHARYWLPEDNTSCSVTKFELIAVNAVGLLYRAFLGAQGTHHKALAIGSFLHIADNPVKLAIKGLAFICHGYAEHLLYYEDLAVRLSDIGVYAFGHDHVGFGKSEGVRGHVSCFDDYVHDVLHHCDTLKKKYPGVPVFIVGHSMGGMIAIRSAMKRPDYFAGVVLMAPLVIPNPAEATPFKLCIAKVLAKILPYIAIGSLDLNMVTRDKDMLTKMEGDSLRYTGGVRAHWATATLHDLQDMGEHLENIEWPYLILHGERDKLCDPTGSKELLQRSRSIDKKLKIYPNAYHHLYIEKSDVRKEAVKDTVDWLEERLPK